MRSSIPIIAALAIVPSASGAIRITEWCYQATPGEWIELTNTGPGAIDLSGWSYDDDSRLPGVFDLSALGVVASGESVVLTDAVAADFRSAWGLSASVKVLGGYTNALGRNDEINIYDDADALVDRLTYGDQNFPGTIRTQDRSGNPLSLAALGANTPGQWVLSAAGDAYGSVANGLGAQGNPGTFTLIPGPGALALAGIGALTCARRRR